MEKCKYSKGCFNSHFNYCPGPKDCKEIETMPTPFEGKVILVTGGTGSFGTAFAKYLMRKRPKKLIIFSRDWLKQKQLKSQLGEQQFMRYFIGDIRDKDRLIRAMNGVDIVIHAGAIKDLESCEYNPSECLQTNIIGTQNVIDACIERKVTKCLLISTDKAVNPINTYGTSKAMAEKLWVNGNKYSANDGTIFSICRYGNIVGSSGSVVPVWKQMIERGDDYLPITHEEMTRFWFNMDDALQFVEDSVEKMKGGEIFIPEIPSIKIVDLAEAMGKPYIIVGIRENEKLHEEMELGKPSNLNSWFLTVDEIKETIKDI